MASNQPNSPPRPSLYFRPLPYSLRAILLTSILFTALSGGILTALNWRRLGRPHLALPTFLFGALIFVISAAVCNLLLQQPQSAAAIAVLLLINLWTGLVFIASQSRAFRRWLREHSGKAPAINQSGCITYGTVLLLTIGMGYLALFYLSGPMAELLLRMRPGQSVHFAEVEMIVPGNWIQIDTALLSPSYCIQSGATCLYAGTRPGSEMVFGLRRLSGEAFAKATPDQFDSQGWELIKGQVAGVHLLAHGRRMLNGRPATQRVILQPGTEAGYLVRVIVLIKEADGSILQFDLTANAESYRQHVAEVETILGSIHFADSREIF